MTSPSDIAPLIESMLEKGASDLYINVGSPPVLRFDSAIQPANDSILRAEDTVRLIRELLGPFEWQELERSHEHNSSIEWQGRGRLRINCYRQQLAYGMVIRRVRMDIPTLESLSLSKVYADLIMEKRGLILVVGQTGSGKTTSLAAMLGHRNSHGTGHIITIEDPIEFVHIPQRCIVTQREVGIDTDSFGTALKNALRQRPDVVLIGEIRDLETMESALNFAETGHLCLATLHAGNVMQTIERMVSFFPDTIQRQVRAKIAQNLRAVLCQRLVPNRHHARSLATEIMLNRGLIRSLIEEGKYRDIPEVVAKSREEGMHIFDQSLLDLCLSGTVAEDIALAEADNPANLRLALKQGAAANASGPKGGGVAVQTHFRI